ncbi:MAG: crossover junction endodeoxyribonuclease RuvC [Myxococcota bacterium]|nr:crossover junction endodeoxyribonuclease RuvC [Myxococcota bacterium]
MPEQCPVIQTVVYCTPVHPLGAPLLVFGIDPGSTATGFSVVYRESNRFVLVDAGVIRTRVKDPIPTRLKVIHDGLTEALEKFKPECVAIESIFKHRSSESALRLGQARGVALLAAAQHDLEVTAYNPMTVKKSVGGSGRAAKAEMVRLVARLVGKQLPSDAADATAIAITHIITSAFTSRVNRTTPATRSRR